MGIPSGAVAGSTFSYEGTAIDAQDGDSVLLALLRSGRRPTEGGPLCLAGDCPNCLCTADGVSYVRACQTAATGVTDVAPHPTTGEPPLPPFDETAVDITVDRRQADVVVIGHGRSGTAAAEDARAEGRAVEVVDAGEGVEAIGIYVGPHVVARTPNGTREIHAESVVVATGSSEIQPVVPGSGLAGIYTPRAARTVLDAGIELGTIVAVGDVDDETLSAASLDGVVAGELVRFEPAAGSSNVGAVVTKTADGEIATPCDTVIVGLGRAPRDMLARMAGPGEATIVGSAATAAPLPQCPNDGVVCPCSNVTMQQLDDVYDRGFTHIELLKRSTLAGTGTCQGGVCLPYLRSFLADRGESIQPAFTARPVARQLTLAEIGAGAHTSTAARTALDGLHRKLGAQMDRMGGWWRPWTYGDPDAEYAAVREAVSLCDVSTLGLMTISGPDAEATLQRLYPTDVSTIRAGRSRYVLMLDERGYVFDDGMIARRDDGTFLLTFTSGGASMAEMWIRDWSAGWGHDIRLLNQTFSTGAINVTGPRATELLTRAGITDPPPWLGHGKYEVAGIPCTIFRLSFTGEVSYELHHPLERSVELWNALSELGADLGCRPHGLETLLRLRLEKGHIIVGQDTDYDSTPRRLRHEWAVNFNSGEFIGRHAVLRTDRIPLDKQLLGLRFDGPPPIEGAVIWSGDEYAGAITSAAWSPSVEAGIALAWVYEVDGGFPTEVRATGPDGEPITGTVTSLPFFDPEGARARA